MTAAAVDLYGPIMLFCLTGLGDGYRLDMQAEGATALIVLVDGEQGTGQEGGGSINLVHLLFYSAPQPMATLAPGISSSVGTAVA